MIEPFCSFLFGVGRADLLDSLGWLCCGIWSRQLTSNREGATGKHTLVRCSPAHAEQHRGLGSAQSIDYLVGRFAQVVPGHLSGVHRD